MFCTNCGAEFEGNFCPACGTPAVGSPLADMPIPPAQAAPPELLADPPLSCCGSYKVLGGTLEVQPDRITIRRSYLTKKFEQNIPLSQIIGIQFSNATFTENGFLHFIVPQNRNETIQNARQADHDPFSLVFNARSDALRQIAQEVAQVCEVRANIKNYSQVRAEQTARAEELRQETTHAWHEVKAAIAPTQTAREDRKKGNQANGVACCPKCGSASIQQEKGKFHLGRAILGNALLPGGTVMGLTHGSNTPMVCLHCGHRWKL